MKNKLYISIILLSLFACKPNYTPKPRGYVRIDFPEKEYVRFDTNCPFSFEYPLYGKIENTHPENNCWINITFDNYNGKIHLSYKQVNNNLSDYIEDSREMVYKHTIKADAIDTKYYSNKKNKVYGLLYDIKGDAASSIQFFVTDSNKHFLRGALYFETTPNKDSLKPAIEFFRKDILHLIETTSWK